MAGKVSFEDEREEEQRHLDGDQDQTDLINKGEDNRVVAEAGSAYQLGIRTRAKRGTDIGSGNLAMHRQMI